MTDSDSARRSDETLKTDALGRVRSTPAQRAALLEAFERSGLSGTKFAAVAGVNYQTFATWRQQQRKRGGSMARMARQPEDTAGGVRPGKTPRTLRWVEAVMDEAKCVPAGSEVTVLVRLPCGARIELCQAAQVPLVVELCRALSREPHRTC